ncbi:hypothetical protein K402DRAFT_389460 [Aulographum hederae CBS 113979]|uniref:Ribosomal protein S36, mitochondrial n=1 Tax=Aulographum hederae CBS 113979 TaxID=1176131 RepID=A0A6G1HE40_9PEZI|nr:hypothetical protein K402DRAFT_389460 [Aulographum hederae CBS 113979]
MQATRYLLQHRQPMIRFLGKRTAPPKLDHTPKAHPASPTHSLPNSFAAYREKAQQHGPLNQKMEYSTSGAIGSHSGSSLGPVEPASGQYFDRSELPKRFRRTPWTQAEIDAIESGGASMF